MIDSMKTSVVIRSYEPDAVESALKDRLMCFILEQGDCHVSESLKASCRNQLHLHCTASTFLDPDHDKNERNEILPTNVSSSTLVFLSVIGAGITSS